MIVVDVETTGLYPWRNGIISIGAVNYDDPEQYFFAEARPSASVEITDGALRVNGYTRESLKVLADPMVTMLSRFLAWCREQKTSYVLAGHNSKFDLDFITQEIERCGLKKNLNPFTHRVYDLHTVAQTHYRQWMGSWYPKDMSADFIQQKLGLPVEPSPHHALNGAVYEAECIARLIEGVSLFDDFKEYPIKENPWE